MPGAEHAANSGRGERERERRGMNKTSRLSVRRKETTATSRQQRWCGRSQRRLSSLMQQLSAAAVLQCENRLSTVSPFISVHFSPSYVAVNAQLTAVTINRCFPLLRLQQCFALAPFRHDRGCFLMTFLAAKLATSMSSSYIHEVAQQLEVTPCSIYSSAHRSTLHCSTLLCVCCVQYAARLIRRQQ